MAHLEAPTIHHVLFTLLLLIGLGGCGSAEVGEYCELSYGRAEFEDPMFSASVDSDNNDCASGICMGTQQGDYCSDRCTDDEDCPGTMKCEWFGSVPEGELYYCWLPLE